MEHLALLSPGNHLSSQYLETYSILKFQCPHLAESQNSLLGKTQPPHPPKKAIIVVLEKCHIAEAHKNDLNKAFMTMIKVFKEEVNKSLKVVY